MIRVPSSSTRPPGEIRRDSLYTLQEVARRLRWERRAMSKAQRDGLRTIKYGRIKYVTGLAVAEFFERMAEGER